MLNISLLIFLLFLCPNYIFFSFFFFNDTATTEIYTLSLHDALPISSIPRSASRSAARRRRRRPGWKRSEEHTSELQSRSDIVCRLLLEKKKINKPPSSMQNKTTPTITKVKMHMTY